MAGGGAGAGCTSGHNRLSVIASQTSGLAGEAGGPNPTTDLTTQTQTSYRASGLTLQPRSERRTKLSLFRMYLSAAGLLCLAERYEKHKSSVLPAAAVVPVSGWGGGRY